jgi:hypothetical protein
MTNGSITLNGITDQQLIVILEAKVKNERVLAFNPQQMQPVNQGAPGKPAKQTYNNVSLIWQNEDGARVGIDLLKRLLEVTEPVTA